MTRATTIANSTYRAMSDPCLPAAVTAGSRCLFGLDHVFREEYQPGEQAVESDQEEKHQHNCEHFSPPSFMERFLVKYRAVGRQVLMCVKPR